MSNPRLGAVDELAPHPPRLPRGLVRNAAEERYRKGLKPFVVPICAAIWLFFHYVPAHGEEPKIEDSWWYDFCVPIRDADLEWLIKALDEHPIKSSKPPSPGRWCGTLSGADLRWYVDELRKRGYDMAPVK
jgi:hypothetical protein